MSRRDIDRWERTTDRWFIAGLVGLAFAVAGAVYPPMGVALTVLLLALASGLVVIAVLAAYVVWQDHRERRSSPDEPSAADTADDAPDRRWSR